MLVWALKPQMPHRPGKPDKRKQPEITAKAQMEMTVSREKKKKIQDLIPLKISQSLYPRENISIRVEIFT